MVRFQYPSGVWDFLTPGICMQKGKGVFNAEASNAKLPSSLCVKRRLSFAVGLDGGHNSTMDVGTLGNI
jgi:hypothetical protein